jgi:hypothetical protein
MGYTSAETVPDIFTALHGWAATPVAINDAKLIGIPYLQISISPKFT